MNELFKSDSGLFIKVFKSRLLQYVGLSIDPSVRQSVSSSVCPFSSYVPGIYHMSSEIDSTEHGFGWLVKPCSVEMHPMYTLYNHVNIIFIRLFNTLSIIDCGAVSIIDEPNTNFMCRYCRTSVSKLKRWRKKSYYKSSLYSCWSGRNPFVNDCSVLLVLTVSQFISLYVVPLQLAVNNSFPL